ncbi:MAG: phenylacetate--CoA ligase family protein [Candidatus Cloacimonetes bacterium]|nr:phenylacetate--CoA ligase family protein [Candidatus Cloacimonadota bacterium]
MNIIYEKLPVLLQNIFCSAYGYKMKKQRFGNFFQKKLEWLENSQWWTKSEIENYQNEELTEIVKHAYNTVPYYNDLFRRSKLSPNDIRTKADLYKIPILTKEIVRENWKQLISNGYKKKELIPIHTSGSTGKALEFYLTQKALQFQWAVWWRFRKRFGINFGDSHCNFTGKIAVPLNQKNPPFWRHNKPLNQYIINMHHIIPQNIKSIVNFLNSKKFKFYSGYPSIIYNLCTLIAEEKLSITSPPEFVFTGAENLLENQRRIIQDVLGCTVTDQYGFAECCGNASRCEKDYFHEDFEFGILEGVDEENLSRNKGTGKIVATGFANYAMPFLRYEVGDVGTWVRKNCKCGRKSSILVRIDGRDEDYIITPEGRKIMRFDYVFKDFKNIKEAQIIQKKLGEIMIKIVKRENYSLKDEKQIESEIAKWISPKLNVNFLYVNEIERDSSGKFKAIKSLL